MSPGTLREHRWSVERPNILVVACSDGRLQEVTDDFLLNALGISRYDRFYAPGGAGALAATGRDFSRAQAMRAECRYLVELHRITRVVLLFHGPAPTGPATAICADYQRKLPEASGAIVRERQNADAHELHLHAREFAAEASIHFYRCEVDENGWATFVNLD
jgi:hypothetical protein